MQLLLAFCWPERVGLEVPRTRLSSRSITLGLFVSMPRPDSEVVNIIITDLCDQTRKTLFRMFDFYKL